MKFYILGATGFIGNNRMIDFLKKNGHEVLTERIDLSDYPALRNRFAETKPDVIINFAGARAEPHIDWCEDHKKETALVNLAGSINFVHAAMEAGAHPIQVASGCIYEGGPDREFTEEDEPNFFGSFYSRVRVAQQIVLKELPVLFIRIRMPVSIYPHPRNFITKITSYTKVINEPNSITVLEDLYPALLKLSELKTTGILNLTNDGWINHKMVLDAYKEIVDPSHTYIPISLDEFDGPNGFVKARRSNCILSNQKAKSLGIEMPPMTQERLREIMKIYKASLDMKAASIPE